MKIPFFHDMDCKGYFGVLNSSNGDVLYVSDADVNRSHSIGKAFEDFGTFTRLTNPSSYQQARLVLLA